MRRFSALACVALVMFAGCRDRSSVQDKQDKLCSQLGVMDKTVTELAGLPPTATVQQVKTLKAQLDAEYRQVQTAAKDVSAFTIAPITDAYNQLAKTVNGITTQDGVAAALPQINDEAGTFSDARLQVNTNGACA